MCIHTMSTLQRGKYKKTMTMFEKMILALRRTVKRVDFTQFALSYMFNIAVFEGMV